MSRLDERGLPEGAVLREHLEIAPREVDRRRRAGEALRIVDCRSELERAIATLADTEHVPMERVVEWIDDLRDDPDDRPIVVHCHHGIRSLQVVALLHEAGFGNARSMAGGIHLWSQAVDSSVATY
ncbi:MAG: rhodanese-like domain-containing protein [Phycisphaerales bacterium]